MGKRANTSLSKFDLAFTCLILSSSSEQHRLPIIAKKHHKTNQNDKLTRKVEKRLEGKTRPHLHLHLFQGTAFDFQPGRQVILLSGISMALLHFCIPRLSTPAWTSCLSPVVVSLRARRTATLQHHENIREPDIKGLRQVLLQVHAKLLFCSGLSLPHRLSASRFKI